MIGCRVSLKCWFSATISLLARLVNQANRRIIRLLRKSSVIVRPGADDVTGSDIGLNV